MSFDMFDNLANLDLIGHEAPTNKICTVTRMRPICMAREQSIETHNIRQFYDVLWQGSTAVVLHEEFQIRSKSTGTGHLFEHSSWPLGRRTHLFAAIRWVDGPG